MYFYRLFRDVCFYDRKYIEWFENIIGEFDRKLGELGRIFRGNDIWFRV